MKKHLLTILVEDYFQVGAFGHLIEEGNWTRFETRYEDNTRRVLDLLDELNTKATFFVLGWIAERSPELVRQIVSRGHEVASRGFYHRPLNYLSLQEFRQDLKRTTKVLEDACGQKVLGYRAARKLDFAKDSWIFEVLAEEGFLYDASFLPKRASENRFVHQVSVNGQKIWEFPYSTERVGFFLLPISGGNYFRQIPYTLMRPFVRKWIETEQAPFVFYFHVWELDKTQPRISAAPFYNRIRHYRKLDKIEWIIRENLTKYEFSSIAEYLKLPREIKASLCSENVRKEHEILRVTDLTDVTIVVPCYNEAETLIFLKKTLLELEKELVKSGYRANFIFVDDGSKDKTFEKLEELFSGHENTQIIKHQKNLGVAASIMTGLREAKTEIVCSIDCDCSYDPYYLLKMIPMLDEKTDIVTASPYHPEGKVKNVPAWRLLLSKGASFLYKVVLGVEISTYTSCFRVYRRSRLLNMSIREKNFLGVSEILGKVLLAGGKVVEYPAVLQVRLFGFSKMKTLKVILGHLSLLLRLAFLRFFGKRNRIQSFPTNENSGVVRNEAKN
ncbi:MAG: DUF3473 domain-containing protein [Pyrinomonadaceae bacterium]|nr:DUF3473 domain-containing protein [Pyrinomonadaceae bacterium]MCX7638998.1 DUF3473 domain-containing protein [Pyrinomonadaceae bacterium]MDW8303782.1 DUF3473 domain-containing protein [Acidobacteriota bacterium]